MIKAGNTGDTTGGMINISSGHSSRTSSGDINVKTANSGTQGASGSINIQSGTSFLVIVVILVFVQEHLYRVREGIFSC